MFQSKIIDFLLSFNLKYSNYCTNIYIKWYWWRVGGTLSLKCNPLLNIWYKSTLKYHSQTFQRLDSFENISTWIKLFILILFILFTFNKLQWNIDTHRDEYEQACLSIFYSWNPFIGFMHVFLLFLFVVLY